MSVKIEDAAQVKIKEIIESNWQGKSCYLRMKVVGGGCSGFSYGLDIVDEEVEPIDPQDKVFEFPGFRAVVDGKSYLYLNGTTLEYITQGLKGGFNFVNPNAKASCGCGSSFSA
jgi:iron-sulfur cluster assembly accessory protein